jgi:hypothetical protein
LEAEPPPNAVGLFQGGTLDAWVDGEGRAAHWRVVDGALEVAPGAGDIYTRRAFSDFYLHIEFWLPHMPEAIGQDRANSGVFLQGRYELQILDSFGLEATNDGCGAIYKAVPPSSNACRRPEVWQVFDVAFRSGRSDAARSVDEPARVTVFLNGILIHNNVVIAAPTPGAIAVECQTTSGTDPLATLKVTPSFVQ